MVSEFHGSRRPLRASSNSLPTAVVVPDPTSDIMDAFKVEDLGTPPMGWMPRGQLMDLLRAIDAKRTSDGKG